MSGKIPKKTTGCGDPKFCSCAACKALREGQIEQEQERCPLLPIPAVAMPAPADPRRSGPFPASKFPHGTLEFSARGFSGYYNSAGEWISTSSHRFTGKV